MSDPTESNPSSDSTPPAAPAYQAQPAPVYPPSANQPMAYGQQAPPPHFNVLAIVSFVSAFVVSLAAIITGHIAISQIKKTGERGRGLAIAGLVLGYVGLVSGIIATIIIISLVLARMADPNFMMYNRY